MTTLLEANINSIVTTKEAKSKGLTKQRLRELLDDNKLERVGYGLYAPADAWVDELYIIHKRCPSAVFSHDEAFYHHGLIDREPLQHTLTVYSGFNAHRLKASSNVKVYSVKKELLDVGKIAITDFLGNDIPMYNLERTICDALRGRNSIEAQDFSSILKTYVAMPNKDINKLMEYAKLFRVNNVARRYFEVLL